MAAADNRPLTRRGCALGCGLWLAVMAGLTLVGLLALQRELAWTRGPGGLEQDRLFVVDGEQAAGLGYLAARLTGPVAADGPACVATRVVYWLWRNAAAEDPAARYCQCYTRAADGAWTVSGDCPAGPP